MNRFEAQNSYTQVFAHMSFLKNFSYIYIQNVFKYSLLLINSILCIIPSNDQNYFVIYQNLFKILFQNSAFDLRRSTGRSTDSVSCQIGRPTGRPEIWPFGCVHVCTSPGRPSGRPDPISVDRPSADWKPATLCLLRSTGRSTVGRNGLIFLKPGRSAGRPRLCFSLNGYFLKHILNRPFCL